LDVLQAISLISQSCLKAKNTASFGSHLVKMLRKFTIVNYRHNRAKVATKSACSLSAQLLDYYACNSIGPWLQFARKA
jgi:hypothetical protein